MSKPKLRFVASYDSQGRRLRSYSIEACARLLQMGRVVPTFSRLGTLIAITFRPHPGTSVLKTAHMGQRYSFQEHVGDHRAWTHSPMLSPRSLSHMAQRELEAEEAELYLMRIFRAVPLSCMTPAPDAPAKVVCIDSARAKRDNTHEKVAA